MEENSVRKGNVGDDNKLEEATSKETNDGEFVNVGKWISKPEEFDILSALYGNGIKSQTN